MEHVEESFHGSDLETIAERFSMRTSEIIPFASNVNPLGISPLARQALLDHIDAVSAYPDRSYTALKNAICQYCGADASQLILGNGTSELIRLVFKILSPKKTVVIGPTYSEYARAAQLQGSTVTTYLLREPDEFKLDIESFFHALDSSTDLLVICNPNNPTGTAIPASDMDAIFSQCRSCGIFVLVDETYVEFVENVAQISSVPLTRKYDNALVLRGVSKFFAAPGLRLGYAVTQNPVLLDAASNDNIPWNINAYACVASVMFQDYRYINLTRSLIYTERNLVCAALSTCRTIKFYRPAANFVLIKLQKKELTASNVFHHCIQKGFMIRDCTDYEGLGSKYIRFCFMKPQQNDGMVNTLLEVV